MNTSSRTPPAGSSGTVQPRRCRATPNSAKPASDNLSAAEASRTTCHFSLLGKENSLLAAQIPRAADKQASPPQQGFAWARFSNSISVLIAQFLPPDRQPDNNDPGIKS